MSMVMSLWRLRPEELEAIAKDPEALYDMMETVEPESEEWERRCCDLHKSWDIIHYLLTDTEAGDEWPANALLAGEPLYDMPSGDVPPSVLTPVQVREFAAYLESVDDDSLRARFDVDAMAAANVYLANTGEPESELMDDVFFFVGNLRECIRAAAAAGDAVIVTID